jgi:Carboxypeptidase regulatory-like domain
MNKKQNVGSFKVFALMAGLVALMAVLLCVTPAFADNLYGTIRGVVADPSGAVLPGVQVKVTNVNTGLVKELTTGTDGGFQFVELQPGKYDLSATKANFKLFQTRGIEIIQNQTYVQNVKMELGAASEVLEVTANAAQVETTSIQLGATLSGDMVRDLPTLNRNWITLQQTLPGVVTPDTRFGTNYSTNGSQAQQNSYLVNGTDANDLPLNSPLTQPNPDAIDEVQMVTNTINPEYGRNSGAIMNATTKHGENRFHGSAFEYYRDTFLNTANFFQYNTTTNSKTVPQLHQNQLGGTIGGPIWRNRIFFFYALQITRARTPEVEAFNTQNVFTPAEFNNGDWSSVTLSANPIPSALSIVGPGGSCAAGTAWNACFAGNQVPTSNYSSLSSQLVGKFVPLSATGIIPVTPTTFVKENQHIGRLDFNFGPKDAVWFYALANDRSSLNDLPFTGATLPGFGDSSVPYTKQFTAAWTHTFSPTLLNEFRPGYTRLNFPTGQPQHVRQPSAVGFPNIFPQLASAADYPQMALTGYFTLGGTNNGPQPRKDQTYQLTDNLSWIKGKHSLKFGYAGRKFQVWNPFLASNEGTFTFDASGTFSTGDPGLDFLLGVPLNFNQQSGSTIIADAYEHYFYAQDQWQVRSNLTLTLGTGYQIDTPISEYQNAGLSRVCFNPAIQSTVFPTAPMGLIFPGDPGCNKQGGPKTKYSHFGPRVGFAWSPDRGRLTGGAGKTSVRGGFGLYFNRSEEELNLQDLSAPPFGLSSNGATNPSFPNPYADINGGAGVPINPFPYVPPKPGNTSINFAAFEPFGFSTQVNGPNLTAPYAMNWNVSVQRELPGRTILQIGYVGSHGGDLITSYTANPATPAGVQACAADPVCVANAPNQPILYPSHYAYPGDIWGNFGQQTNGGRSNYHSLQVSAEKHMSRGLTFQTAYTWAHALDVSSSFEDTAFQVAGGVDSYGHFGRDYGSSAFDARQRWVISWVYNVPNPGKNWGAFASRALGGWTFTGDNAFQSGFPINFYDSSMLSLNCSWTNSYYGCSDRPDIVNRPKSLDPRSASFNGHPNYWFDPSSFTHNALGTEGNTPRGYFNGPGFWNADATLGKETKITEGSSLKMRIDFFNIFNHTNFANPSGNVASSRFGRIIGIRNFTNSRLIQLGADLRF